MNTSFTGGCPDGEVQEEEGIASFSALLLEYCCCMLDIHVFELGPTTSALL